MNIQIREVLWPGFESGSRDREWEAKFAILEFSKRKSEFIQWISKDRHPRTWDRCVRFLD